MKRNFKKIVSLLTVTCLLFFSASLIFVSSSVSTFVSNIDWKKFSANGVDSSLSVSKGKMTCCFNISDRTVKLSLGNNVVNSMPTAEIVGLSRLTAISTCSLTIMNDKAETETIYSFSDASFSLYTAEDRFRVFYDFKKLGIKVPIDFWIVDEQTLKLTISVPEIVDENNILLDITVLPYFGAGSIDDSGYILVPDGSGAAIKFSNGKADFGTIRYSVYGIDAMTKKDYAELNSNYVNLPMYAFMYGNNSALVSYIDEGDALASLNVSVGNSECPYTTAYYTFNYRPYTLTTILDRTSKAQKLYIASKETVNSRKFEISYRYFGNDTNLSDIANHVGKKVFGSRKAKEKAESKAYLDVYMNVYKRVYTMGVPHDSTVPLTTLDECASIASDFGNPVMMLRGLDKYGAVSGPIDNSFSINGTSGKQSEYQLLSKKAQLYPVAEFVKYNRSIYGYSKMFNSSRSVTGKSINSYTYNPATLLADAETFNIIDPNLICKAVSDYISSANKKSVKGIAPISLSNSPYTNNKKSDRQNTTNIFAESLKEIKDSNYKLLVHNPDAFSLAYAEKAISLPTVSSGQSLIDYDIPFIQMVVGKYIDYSGEAVNISGDNKLSVLNSAKTGSNLCFAIMNCDYKTVKNTPLDYLYAADYRISGKLCLEIYNEYSKRMESCVNKRIVGFTCLTSDISITEFEDSIKVYVNYSDKDYVTENGVTVKQTDYYVEVS